MAESMKGISRTHRCAETVNAQIGERVTVMGWVNKRRDLGSLIFVDLRDRTGLLQVVFDEPRLGAAGFEKAQGIRSEYVLAVSGVIERRSAAVNERLETGSIELLSDELRILSESETPPFPIEERSQTKDEIRLKYRYLDLRRPDLQRNLALKSRVAHLMREFMAGEGFLEIETPMLTKSTPEGARDYLVPSRVHLGSFYALPQSPQLFKQLLMCAGYDRYFQIARCFRDEDLRADRQPEFTQADMELSFADAEDVIDVNERLIKYVFKEAIGVDIELPLPRLSWREAMNRFGTDKPDMRFGMELCDLSGLISGCEFKVFKNAVEGGGSVRGICLPGMASLSRKKIDALRDFAKGYGAGGLAYLGINEDGTYKSSFAKFMREEELLSIIEAMKAAPGDLILIAADRDQIVWGVLGALRVHMADKMGVIDKSEYRFLWVTDFPMFEWSEDEERFVAMHHPFTMPKEEDVGKIDTDPGAVRAEAYDIVLNGSELGGGSVRIHRRDVQEKVFKAIGFDREESYARFGFLLEAFRYGVPPHAGLAYGLDRMVMHMAGAESIRDVIAFPKVKDASCLLSGAPGVVEAGQLEELGLSVSRGSEGNPGEKT